MRGAQAGVSSGEPYRSLVRAGPNLVNVWKKTGRVLHKALDLPPLFINGVPPARSESHFRLILPLQQMRQEHAEAGPQLAAIASTQGFNLLLDVIPIEFVGPAFAQASSHELRPAIEVRFVKRRSTMGFDRFRVRHDDYQIQYDKCRFLRTIKQWTGPRRHPRAGRLHWWQPKVGSLQR